MFDYRFLYLLDFEDQFSATGEVDTFGSPQSDIQPLFSEVSITLTSNELDINSAWKSLEAGCVFVWLKFKSVVSTHSP